MSVEKSWKVIQEWLAENMPSVVDGLQPGATDEQIKRCEEDIGLELPESLRALYRLHDGEEDMFSPGVFDGGHRLLSLEDVAGEADAARQVAEAFEDDQKTFADWRADLEDGMLAISGPVKALVHSPKWIPFTEYFDDDRRRCIDFDPAPGGTIGQIIEHDEGNDHWKVLAPSFEEYLANYAEGLTSGRYVRRGKRIRDTRKDSPNKWGVPAYLEGPEMEDGSTYVPRSSPTVDEISIDEPVTMAGSIGMLFGPTFKGGEVIFVFIHDDGRKYTVFASKSATDGYERIFDGGEITLAATRYDGNSEEFVEGTKSDDPELVARSIGKAD